MTYTPSKIRDRDKMISPGICFACGKERDGRKLIIHVVDMKTYCKDLHDCGKPQKNIISLMGKYPYLPEYQIEPVNVESKELEEAMESFYSPNAYESLLKIIGKTATARFNTRQALFMCKLAQEKDLTNVQGIIRYVMDTLMESEEGQKIMNKELTGTKLVNIDEK